MGFLHGNLEVMARQYLARHTPGNLSIGRAALLQGGRCVAFSAKRKSSEAETLQNLTFANANLRRWRLNV